MPKTKMKCKMCNKEFYFYYRKSKTYKRKCCSRKCADNFKRTPQQRQKLKNKLTGLFRHTEETKRKMSEAKIGKVNKGFLGKHHSEETKRKISEILKIKCVVKRGKDSNLWRGGISYEPYSMNWTNILRENIRKRDKYICQICGINQRELTGRLKKLDIHHINYVKKDCNPVNLITLCRKCHIKTNHNREYWIDYFLKVVN